MEGAGDKASGLAPNSRKRVQLSERSGWASRLRTGCPKAISVREALGGLPDVSPIASLSEKQTQR